MAGSVNPGAAVLLLDRISKIPAPLPAQSSRPFGVWVGADSGGYGVGFTELIDATFALVPPGVEWTDVQMLIKAGEGGSWQAQLSPAPLAVKSEDDLSDKHTVGSIYAMTVVPYVVVRGRAAWIPAEIAQIQACIRACGMCVLNVEPGAPYWNGSTSPEIIRQYLASIDAATPAELQVAMIPRQGQVDELGGAATIAAWTDPQYVGSAAWETYGLAAGISGPTSLLVDEAIPRLDGWGVPPGDQYRIPIVQRDERERWADTDWTAAGMQVWYIFGN